MLISTSIYHILSSLLHFYKQNSFNLIRPLLKFRIYLLIILILIIKILLLGLVYKMFMKFVLYSILFSLLFYFIISNLDEKQRGFLRLLNEKINNILK